MKRLIILPLICALLCSCGGAPLRKTVYSMDTAVTLTVCGGNAEAALSAAEAEIYRLDALMSRSNERGDIYPINLNGSGEISEETAHVIADALDVCRETDGAFDITITPVTDAWGFFGHEYRVPSDEEIKQRLKSVDYKNVALNGNSLTLNNGAEIDLGGIAKGYAAESAANALKKYGVTSALISFGSSIQAIGTKPDGSEWAIGIANPRNSEENIARLTISDTCIATSGSYEQSFEENGKRYHHIIDPSTGYPAESGLASVSVICDDATRADALSTALFVMGLDKSLEFLKNAENIKAVFITDDNEVIYTRSLAGSISVSEGSAKAV